MEDQKIFESTLNELEKRVSRLEHKDRIHRRIRLVLGILIFLYFAAAFTFIPRYIDTLTSF